jgi:hypothetical protein
LSLQAVAVVALIHPTNTQAAVLVVQVVCVAQ